MTEQDVQSAISKYLTKLGAYVVITIVTSRSGTPDLILSLNGKFIGIEVKLPGEKPRPLQEAHLHLINQSGGIAFAATSVAEVTAQLESHGLIPTAEFDV